MAIRVVHIGTGNVGRLALSGLINNPRFELTGFCVSSDAKVGKDAGHLAGLDALTWIAATTTWTLCWRPTLNASCTAPWPTTEWAGR